MKIGFGNPVQRVRHFLTRINNLNSKLDMMNSKLDMIWNRLDDFAAPELQEKLDSISEGLGVDRATALDLLAAVAMMMNMQHEQRITLERLERLCRTSSQKATPSDSAQYLK